MVQANQGCACTLTFLLAFKITPALRNAAWIQGPRPRLLHRQELGGVWCGPGECIAPVLGWKCFSRELAWYLVQKKNMFSRPEWRWGFRHWEYLSRQCYLPLCCIVLCLYLHSIALAGIKSAVVNAEARDTVFFLALKPPEKPRASVKAARPLCLSFHREPNLGEFACAHSPTEKTHLVPI